MALKAKDLKVGDYLRYNGGATGLSNLLRRGIAAGDVLEVVRLDSLSTVAVKVYGSNGNTPIQLTDGGSLRLCTKIPSPPVRLRGPEDWRRGDLAYLATVPDARTASVGDILTVTSVQRGSAYASNRQINGRITAHRVLTREEINDLPNGTKIMRVKRMGDAMPGSTLVKDQYTSPQQHGDLSWALVSLPPSPQDQRKAKLLSDISEMKAKLAEMEREAQS